jgi:phage tail sheath protein FI
MSERTYPGVYIEEKSAGPGPIQGVSTSNLGLIGFSRKGHINKPMLFNSFPEFEAKCGTFTSKSLGPTEAFAYFSNGGRNLYFVRAVHEADAVKALTFLTKPMTNVAVVAGSSAPSYSFYLTKQPVVPAGVYGVGSYAFTASLVITTTNGGGTPKRNIFTDAGDGTFTVTTEGGAGGGTGSIDYETGEVRLNLTTPADFPTGQSATASWFYKTLEFEMQWPGEAGNDYRVTIAGSPDYYNAPTASYTRYDVTVSEYNAQTDEWTVAETFQSVVINDASDPSFIATVINDKSKGSDVLNVFVFNRESPPELAGTARVNMDVSNAPAYDGLAKAFTYQIGSSVALKTFVCQFGFLSDDLPIIAGTPTSGDTDFSWVPSTPSQLHPNTSSTKAEANAGLKISLELVTGGVKTAGDDGLGNIRLIAAGVCTGSIIGTVNYVTGAWSLDVTGISDTLEATDIEITQLYYGPVVVDDGNGGLALQNPAGPYGLNSNGINTLDYASGAFSLTWKITGNPAGGPSASTYPLVSPITKPQYASFYTAVPSSFAKRLFDGDDGSSLDRSDVTGATLVADYKGLYALDQVDAMMTVVAADFQTSEFVSGDIIDFCRLRKDKFAPFTIPEGLDPSEAVNWKKFTLARNTDLAALYYPHIRITDPVNNAAMNLPCGGHVAGVFARTDVVRNVGKAPAGVVDGALAWLIGLERDLTPDQVGLCTQNKINCLVSWPHTGLCVWGARTLDIAGGAWPYIQMRRLFQFVEKSVFNATHIHVFENNGPQLWTSIKLQLDSFLLGLFQQGYFRGTSPGSAFFVKCDETNNQPNTVDQGLVFVDVGLAPNRPAEFIVFRFNQVALAG